MRLGESIVNYGVLAGPFAFGLTLSVLLPVCYRWPLSSALAVALSFILCGALLIYAKLPNLKSGQLISFGLSSIEPKMKKYYLLSYFFFLVGLLLSITLVAASKL